MNEYAVDKCFECDDFFTCDGQCDEVEDEPQTEEEYINNLPWTEVGNEEQTDCPYREYPCDVCDRQTDCPWK